MIKNLFSSIGVNPTHHSLTVSPNGTVAYSSSDQVVIRPPPHSSCPGSVVALKVPKRSKELLVDVPETAASVFADFSQTYNAEDIHNTVRVNTVKFLNDNCVLCGTNDGRIVVVNKNESGEWKMGIVSELKNALCKDGTIFSTDETSVLCLDNCSFSSGKRTLLAAATASNAAAIFVSDTPETIVNHGPSTPSCIVRLVSKRALLECCAVTVLEKPDTEPVEVVALGGTDCRVHVYARKSSSSSSGDFVHCASLPGHQGWVGCLSFGPSENGSALLSSGSHDGKIRLWSISLSTDSQVPVDCVLDSVLAGHDSWVTSLTWSGPSCLLSCSMDRTVCMWIPGEGNIWTNAVRLWGVPTSLMGGTIYGFYTVCVSGDGSHVHAQGYTGAVHTWHVSPPLCPGLKVKEDGSVSFSAVPETCYTAGPTQRATSICWCDVPNSPPYLAVSSDDKTIRIYAEDKTEKNKRWAEIARPLTHGHCIRQICFVGRDHSIAVTSEEKAVRVLAAPSTFLETLYNLSSCEMPKDIVALCKKRPLGASLPALSLSNRPIFDEVIEKDGPVTVPVHKKEVNPSEDGEDSMDYSADIPSVPCVLSTVPFEDHLVRNTLWPESKKLFGHKTETLCLGGDCDANNLKPGASLFASGSVNVRPGSCMVCTWNKDNATCLGTGQKHNGNIRSVSCFGGKGLVASASVDGIIVWKQKDKLVPVADIKGVLKLQPLSMKFSPDGVLIACTGGPGGSVAILRIVEEPEEVIVAPCGCFCKPENDKEVREVVTSVAWFAVPKAEKKYLLATGTSIGRIFIWNIVCEDTVTASVDVKLAVELSADVSHTDCVNGLDWYSRNDDDGRFELLLASCGDDWMVRINSIDGIIQ